MIRKIFFLVLAVALTNCGYEPIHSKKNSSNIVIEKYKLIGDKTVNRNIVSSLSLKNNNKEKSNYELIVDSKKQLQIVSKDKTGNTSVYRTIIVVKISLNRNNKIIKQKEFSSSFTYKNIKNKFDLSQYQKNIETNIINEITEEIFIFLNS